MTRRSTGQLEVPGVETPAAEPRAKTPTIAGWVRLADEKRERVLRNIEGDADTLITAGLQFGYAAAGVALRLFRKSKPDEPIQLLASDTGEVMALACPHCRNVASQGHLYGGYKPNDPTRHPSIGTLGGCCHCECGALMGPGIGRECEVCKAKEAPFRAAASAEHDRLEEDDVARFDAFLRGRIATWGLGAVGEWPITVTTGRDGIGVLAFPLALDEVPQDVNERVDALEWFSANHEAPFGRGKTPEEALADLRARADVVRREAESVGEGG